MVCDRRLNDGRLGGSGVEVVEGVDDVEGAVFYFVVDAADVLAEDADGDELDAADEEEADGEGGEAVGGVG